MTCRRRTSVPLSLALLLAVAWGCGKKGPPLPPPGHRPHPPGAVAVVQRGETIVLTFELPAYYTDGDPLEGTPTIVVLRSEPGGRPTVLHRVPPSQVAGAPGEPTRLSVPLDDVFAGIEADRAILSVELHPRSGKPSRPSEAIPVLRVQSPPPPTGLAVRHTPDGPALSWDPALPPWEGLNYNIYRRSVGASGGWGGPRNGEPIRDPEFLDGDAVVGSDYEYEVRAVVPGASPPRESAPAGTGLVAWRDRFPPDAPSAVRAVGGTDGIRVFWFPPPAADLAGYRVYRSEPGGSGRRIVAELLREIPMFLDREVQPGRAYTYVVTAIDGAVPPNEGPGSEPVVETAPGPAASLEPGEER